MTHDELRKLAEVATPSEWVNYHVAVRVLEYLGLDPNDGGAETILDAIEDMKKDAERYRWLRRDDNDEKVLCQGPIVMTYWYLLRKEKLDEAIDAAIIAEKGDAA